MINLHPLRHFVLPIILSTAFFFAACDRKVNQFTTVTLIIPENIQQAASVAPSPLVSSEKLETHSNFMSQNLSLPVGAQYSSGDWWSITPTGYAGRYDINCYVVLVSSDSDLNDKTCYATDLTSFDYGIYSDSTTVGANAISVDVPAGKSRVFRLMGMHADTSYDCYFLTRAPYTGRDRLSRLYEVAASNVTDIAASDKPVTVELTRGTFDVLKAMDNCESRTPTVPSVGKLQVTTDTNMLGGNLVVSQCVPVRIASKDSEGKDSVYSYDDNYALTFSTSSSTYVNSYETYKSCIASTSGTASFTMQNRSERYRWVKPNASVHGVSDTIPNYMVTTDSSIAAIDNVDYTYLANVSTTTVVPLAYFPATVKNNSCVPISVAMRSHDWSTYASTTSSTVIFNSYTLRTDAGQVRYFTDKNCLTGMGINATVGVTYTDWQATLSVSSTPLSIQTIYAQYVGFTVAQPVIGLVYSQGRVSTYQTQVLPSLNTVIDLVPTLTTPNYSLRIDGPTQFLSAVSVSNTACLGPYKSSLVSSVTGAEVGTADEIRTFTADAFYLNTVLEHYSADPLKPPCDSSTLQVTGANSYFGGSLSNVTLFYLKVKNGVSATFDKTQYFYLNSSSTTNYNPYLRRGVVQLNFSIDTDGTLPALQTAPSMETGSGGIQKWFSLPK